MENNKITLCGKLIDNLRFSHECCGEIFYSSWIECYRTSGISDILQIIVSEKLIGSYDVENEYVSIEGNIRTHNDEGRLITTVFVDDIDTLSLYPTENRIDINDVTLEGFICRKNALRKSPGGRILIDFTLAVNRQYGKSDYIPIVAWGRNAIYLDKLDIGRKVKVLGRFQSRPYLKGCEEKIAYEVSAQSITEQD